MLRGRLAVSVSAWLVLASLAQPASAQPNRRSIYAGVLDSAGVPVESVNPEQLTVREDKVAREVLEVWPATEPMDLAILIDNSAASDSYIGDYRNAIPAFITAIGADDTGARHQIAVITLAERPTIKADYTPVLSGPVKAAQSLFAMPGSGTYLLDGIIETSKGLAKRSAERAVIVVITTEGPELSGRPYQNVLDALRASGATLRVVVMGRPVNSDNDRAVVLGTGTKDSGGSYANIFTGTGLAPTLKKLAAELTHQFKVTYSRPQSLIPPERVTIDAARPGLTVRGAPARTVQERR